MKIDRQIDTFIQQSIQAGKSFEEIKTVLSEAGWTPDRIKKNIDQYYLTDYPVAVPRPRMFISPRLLFLYLFYFIILYSLTVNVVVILFNLIDYFWPGQNKANLHLQFSLSVILVGLPVIFSVNWMIKKVKRATGQESPIVRMILINFTLFMSAIVGISSILSLVYTFLSGDLSLRFFVKTSLLVLIIAGYYFYYRAELRHDEQSV